MIERFIRWLTRILKWETEPIPQMPPEPPQAPVNVPIPVVVEIPIIPPKPPEMTNRDTLYKVAKESLGLDMSPLDLAPDMLACAESLNGVYSKAFGRPILKNVVGTEALLSQLIKDPRFGEVHTPLPGDIVINATGTSTKGAKHGHTGIWGINSVMSNDSFSGKWSANYTLLGWRDYFEVKLGFPSRYFRVR